MTQTTRRHGIVVTLLTDEPVFPGVSGAKQQHLQARRGRHSLRYRLEYKGYPGNVDVIPDKNGLWRFRLGYGFNYYVADMIRSSSAYTTVDAALDAAIKMFVEGRKLSKGKPQRDASAMRIAQAEKEKRRRRK